MSMFLDHAQINVKAGKGGDGMVAFKREKYVPDGGPAGGDGGKGGSIIFEVDAGLRTLLDFRYNRHFRGTPGENGMSKSKYGKSAKDTVVKVPPGTIVRNAETKALLGDLTEPGQQLVVAKGGRGGRGNIKFASPRNPAPEIAENGEPGEELILDLELKVIADVGLVGFPSVGKSTILSVVSSAKPKIGAYHFTTIVPNLGMVKTTSGAQFVMADLPGLIEGASQGVGLGIQFLRHIERTRVILHVLDMGATEGRDPFEDFQTINKELESYELKLLERPMIIVANKMDVPGAKENLEEFRDQLAELYSVADMPRIFEISAYQNQGLDDLLNHTAEVLETTDLFPLFEEEDEASVLYKFEDDQNQGIEITRDSNATWILGGERLEKLFLMTNFNHDESIMRFARQLRGMGIDEKLRERGAQDGDLVRIMDYEFEFVD
ncbi:GTPase ObgE [Jeotgalibaca caeni]|uniref:GTPase ObgE n=1 Tax=Jeotgalibaca caeni TaxID=3028623 RepID=UPI00237DB7C2|nr:GTPase ObgE [Jeotgalibaca caeni]MDE1547900.1 GTPase ObgE [Jeotgalibaca caeni]